MANDHVQVQISVDNVGLIRAGFGMPLILSHNADFGPSRVRLYSSITAVGNDFETDSPEYLAANGFFSQTAQAPRIAIGRAFGSVTQRYTLDTMSLETSFTHQIHVEGEGVAETDVEHAASATANQAEVHRGLVNGLNSAGLVDLTVADLAVSAVDTADNELDFAAPHELETGDGPFQLTNSGGALPAGLALLTDYYIIAADSDSISLAESRALALEGVEIDITGAGTGTHTLVDTTDTQRITNNYTAAYAALVVADTVFTAEADTELFTAVAHGLLTGDGPIRVANGGGALPAGLAAATDYWVIKVDADNFKLATTLGNAVAGTALAITTDGTGTQTLSDTGSTKRPSDPFTVTADSAGEWFSLDIPLESRDVISIRQNHAAPSDTTLAADLAACLLASPLWYQVHTLYNSKAYVEDVAAWVGSNGRTYAFDVNDYDVAYTEKSGTDDVGESLLSLGYSAVMGQYHPRPAAMFSACWMGQWLTTDPGSATAKFKTLEGVETVELNDTQRQNLRDRRMNSYTLEFNRPITWEGYVFSTIYRYIDVRRDVDWLTDEVTKSVFGVIAGAPKIPFTPAGIAKVEGGVAGSVELAVQREVLAEGTTLIGVPDISEIEDADKADRVLRGVKFSGTLTGAIHAVIPITGVVTF